MSLHVQEQTATLFTPHLHPFWCKRCTTAFLRKLSRVQEIVKRDRLMFKGVALTNVNALQFHIALNLFEQHNLYLYCKLIKSPTRDSSNIRATHHVLASCAST